MRITKIEILGFKSFCDRTVLSFSDPITSIVGPNGCGKSNVVDAIRWCMGEQSAKHLRGKAMEDVIFNGSETRGAAGMAEVSLTFENDDRIDVAQVLSAVAEERAQDQDETSEPDEGVEGTTLPGELAKTATEVKEPETGETLAEGGAESAAQGGEDDADVEPDVDPLTASLRTYAEITVTRRLFRDGASEYFINKTPCRLMDITSFFLGTGVGTKAYSIIEQGRIGLIVSAKPEDRRQIIEEAAGITKYKAKKRAAERRMEQTRQNLLRISDIVGEIDKRLGSLRRQAQKAERYKKYKTEMREIDLWGMSQRLLGAIVELQALRSALGEAQERWRLAHTEVESREAALTARRHDVQELERQSSALQEALYDVENRLKLTESRIAFSTREAEETEQRCQAAAAEATALRQAAEEAQAELLRLREQAELASETAGRLEGELEAREGAYRTLRTEQEQTERELETLRSGLSRDEARAARCEETQKSLERRHAELEARLARLADEAEANRTRAEELKAEQRMLEEQLDGLRQTKLSLGEQRDQHAARLKELRHESARSEAEVETLRTELHRRRSRLKALVEIQQRYEGFQKGTRAIMQSHRNQGIRGLVADVVQAPPELEAAVESVLGERLGHIIVESQDVGVDAVEYLKAQAQGRSTFIPLAVQMPMPSPSATTMDNIGVTPEEEAALAEAATFAEAASSTLAPATDAVQMAAGAGLPTPSAAFGGGLDAGAEAISPAGLEEGEEETPQPGVRGELLSLVQCDPAYASVVEVLLGDVLLVEDLGTAIALHRRGEARTLVTLDGDVIDSHGVLTGGSREAGGASVLQQKREIRELEEITARLETDVEAAMSHHVTLKAEISSLDRLLEALTHEKHEGEMSILTHEKDLGRAREEGTRLARQAERLGREREELEAAKRDAAREGEAMATELTRIRAAIAEAIGRRDSLAEVLADLRGRVEAAGHALTASKIAMAEAREKRSGLDTELRRIESAQGDKSLRIQRLMEGVEEGTRRVVELRAGVEEMAAELHGLQRDREQHAEALQGARARCDQERAALDAAEVELRTARGALEAVAGESQRGELRLREVELTRQQLLAQADERYRVDLAATCGEYHLRPLPGELEEARLRELRELIERMGEVNLTAVEEYEELARRYEELTAQKTDLESALGQLERAIAKINRTSRQRFRETFDAVNDHFQRAFPRLFNGGRARLELTGDDDLLEAGVEIFAQPPGKKLGTIDLLSGGEKALTAVSLIFAIFLHKPSPFCLLDEVDAPLDEANVGRFNDLVREMTDRTQFIVITHNKRTMQIADTLYGVTMEEPGISKLVSVNLSALPSRMAA